MSKFRHILEQGLPGISSDDLGSIVAHLEDMGFVEEDDLTYVEEKDLIKFIKPLNARKLITFLKDRVNVDERMNQAAPESIMAEDAGLTRTPSQQSLKTESTFRISKAKIEARLNALHSGGVNVDDAVTRTPSQQSLNTESSGRQSTDENDDFSDDSRSGRIYPIHCKALYDFKARHDSEMTIKIYEDLELRADGDGDGWVKARNSVGQEGYIPESYVDLAGLSAPPVPLSPHSPSLSSGPTSINSGTINSLTKHESEDSSPREVNKTKLHSTEAGSTQKPCFDLLLLGKTGEGKSATGNSILGTRKFVSSSSTESVTKRAEQGWCEHDDYVIHVIDGPGTGDTRMSKKKAVKNVTMEFKNALAFCTEGFHAMVMVYKFGGRYTQEDQESIDFLKRMLGDDVFKTYGICILTCGDQFKGTMEDDQTPDMTILEWVKLQESKTEQENPIKFSNLLAECGNRLMLFDNRTKDQSVKDKQVDDLIKLVKSLPNRGKRYTNEEFQAADLERRKIIIESKLPQLETEIMKKYDLLQNILEKINLEKPDASDDILIVKSKALDLITQIGISDKDTGVLNPFKEKVTHTLEIAKKIKDTMDKQKEDQNAEHQRELGRLQMEISNSRNELAEVVKKNNKQAEDITKLNEKRCNVM